MRLLFCGDIMPGGVLPYQDGYISDSVLNLLKSADCRVGTLECAIGDNIPFDKGKMSMEFGKNIVYAKEKDFDRIKEIDLNVVTLANNHVFDLGADGLLNTIRLLDENGIKYCGAGRNLKEASEPCYITLEGFKIAFIGCCFEGLPPYTIERASATTPGIFQTDENEICHLIVEIKKKVDAVIVLPHWGVEYSYVPPKKCKDLALVMIEAGADAVIGSHTHIMNPRMSYKEKPVYYSLGNFLFPDFCLQVPRPIMYPETREEVYSLPIVTNYPKIIQHPVRVVWKKSSRIGIVPILHFNENEGIKQNCHFVYLNKDNILCLMKGVGKWIGIVIISFLGTKIGETTYFLLRRIISSRYNVIKRFRCKKNS